MSWVSIRFGDLYSEDSRNPEIGIVTSEMLEGRVWFVLSPAEHRGFI